jgi:glycosyltransferase involved in cell wall biosynthesis
LTSEAPLAGVRVAVLNWRDLDHSLAGGSEQYAWEFATGLLEAGAQVQFLCSRDRGQTRRAHRGGIDILRGGGRFTYYLWVAWQLLRSRRRLDVVVDVENGIPQFSPLYVRRACRVVLVMHHVHQDQFGVYFPAPIAAFGRFLEARVMPRLYRRARTVAISGSTREEMQRRLGWQRPVTILANGLAFPVVEGAVPDAGSLDRIVVHGRVVAHKRVDVVVEAFAAALRERPGLRLDICGRGPAEPDVRQKVSDLGVADQVTLHGFVPEEELQELLRGSRLHVCGSDAEGWGLVVIEAAAYGVPTVARRVPGLRDSIRDGSTGWLLDDDGIPLADLLSRGMLAALAELDDDERRTSVAQACRDWAGQFTWAAMHANASAIVAGELAGSGAATMREDTVTEGATVEHTSGPLAG